MQKTSIDDLILNYNDYSAIRKILNAGKNYKYSETYDDVLKHGNVELWRRNKYKESFEELDKHLRNDNLMSQYMVQGCKYVSYLIHKELKDVRHHHYNSESFGIFRKYVVDYFDKRRLSNRTCLPHVVYVDQDIYDKLDKLYKLYNRYDEVLSLNNNWIEDNCSFFKFFIKAYNDYMEKNKPTSLNLNNILTQLEGKVRNTINGIDGRCSTYNYNFKLTPIDKYVEHKEVKPTHKPELETHSHKTLQAQVTNSQTMTPGGETNLKSRPAHPLIQETEITQPNEGMNEAVKTEKAPVEENVADTGYHIRALYDYRTPMTHARDETVGQSQYGPTLESPERLGLKGDQSINAQNGLERDQGFAASMRNTITEVLGSVDPVPLVGVSGGMGALFLLFRYTPVGTFFRGRGYRQRIPTRFDGVYPGFMTDFQGEGYFPNGQFNIAYGPE